MPFGAEWRDDGRVRFRLWAPAARKVQIELGNGKQPMVLPLESRAGGWFELTTDAAKPGTEYSFRINDAQKVPDPASRFQPRDVHGPSEVIGAAAFEWRDQTWRGRPWEEAVIYELHVGAFTPEGSFAGLSERLDYLADLGVTALELMPVSDFAGKRNWGYDGVYHFAPDSSYGRPEDLKELVQNAHGRGLMVLLDVVYNHFGPEGNYLGIYAPQFFTDRHQTPWGNGINFDGAQSRTVRDFFIHNAIFWLNEYHFDGLRLDAVHAIADDSTPDILTELADAVHNSVDPDRHIHLILENDRNQARYLQRTTKAAASHKRELHCQPKTYTAQWNDDIHHALHVLLTSEEDGYYSDYLRNPIAQLGRCLAEGFAYQGEVSSHRNGEARGEDTRGVPLTAFISFLQNHDQVGNRVFGERITKNADPHAVRAAMAVLLLAPSPPMLFMGEEFGAETPFLFFCDFEKDLAAAVTIGRRNEFARFAAFSDPVARERIPDPNALGTFAASRLDWKSIEQPDHREWLGFYKQLLKLRREKIVPLLSAACSVEAKYEVLGVPGLRAYWKFKDGAKLTMLANLGADPLAGVISAAGLPVYRTDNASVDSLQPDSLEPDSLEERELPPWSVVWSVKS
jgi:malto-oligosyltrehalose trehalohydrolase